MKKSFFRRIITVYTVFCILFGICILRIYSIQHSNYSAVADMQFSRKIVIGETRGYIYDINMQPLVNENKKKQYIIMSDESTRNILSNDSLKEIKDGLFVKIESDTLLNESKYIKPFYNVTRYSDNLLCSHIIGYINSSGRGVSGLEKAFDKILTDASGSISVSFNADAENNSINGDGIMLMESNYDSPAGIVLTIDKEIQKIVENTINNSVINCGAVVVLDAKTAEIRAISSVPCYNVSDIAASLSDPDLPFLNRALSAYPVGSVFKPIVAASALSSGYAISDTFECNGFINIGENKFSCFNNNCHGTVDINLATEKSCNTFFINLGLFSGKDNICKSAENFGFGKKTELCSTIISESGNLPEPGEITSDAELANICFGQGSLLATPLQLAAAYNVFANNGLYIEPILLKKLINDEGIDYAYYKSENTHTVISEDIAEIINNCLYNNMINGTGKNANPGNISAAGKTATAQTGRYNDKNEEILCTWFCGFFPFENPEYTVVIMNENGSSASSDCAPVFKEIAERITETKIQPTD